MYETTKNIIALLFVVAAIASYFFTVNEIGADTLRIVTGIIIGYYFKNSRIASAVGFSGK